MTHTLSYIIETDDDLMFEYTKSEFTPYYQPEWVEGVNQFDDISDVDASSVDSPDMVRVPSESGYDYYNKILYAPWTLASFKVSVVIDGYEGNNSFTYDGYNSFLKSKRVASEIYMTLEKNKTHQSREAIVTIKYRSDDSIKRTIRIIQKPCETKLMIDSVLIKNGEAETEILVDSDTFEHTFNVLTNKTDLKQESVTLNIKVNGITNRFYLKSIKKYASIGEIDDNYKYIDGKYYRRRQKYVNGNFVNYYAETTVIDNIAYQLKNYDGAFEVKTLSSDSITFVNYGRTFMEDNAFYLVTLANYDDIDVTCRITFRYN